MAALAVFVVGIVLRLDSLGASLWLDEFGTFWAVERDFVTMLRRCWEFQGQSPLYYALPWLSIHVFGESELALRAPSLVLSGLTTAAMYWGGRTLGDPRTGGWAAALFWLSAPVVRYSVDARPYMLVLLAAAITIAGFAAAIRSASAPGRAGWVVGGAGVAWAHYVHYPLVLGLPASYVLLPRLRLQYRLPQFVRDTFAHVALVSLSAPLLIVLFTRRGALSWIYHWNHAALLEPIIALVPGILVGFVQLIRRRKSDDVAFALQVALLMCVLAQVAAVEGAALIGLNLLTERYVVSILIPAVLFVSMTLARANVFQTAVVVAAFAFVTGASLVATKTAVGTFSGIGGEDWRGAVADLTNRMRNERDPLVLFRSGFVEEDMMPLGSAPPTVLAPLRSPGRAPLPAPVVSLNFRWVHPLRDAYFEQRIAPKVSTASRFFVIGAKGDASSGNYMDRFVYWVNSRWPSRYQVRRTDYGRVELLEFQLSVTGAFIPH